MRIPEKENAIIVRGVVIPCGIVDKTNDKPQTKTDIKKIFTNYLAHETDVQHAWVNNFGVYTLENTLTETETILAGQNVPADSWIASHLIINPNIKEMVSNQELNGYSLGAVNDQQLKDNQNFLNKNYFLNKSLRYEDLNDAEELNPIFISFVDKPANGFKWEVYDYNSFLEKSLTGERMTDIDEKQIQEGYVSEGFLERILGSFLNKSEEEVEEKPEDEPMEKEDETSVDDITNKELLEQLPGAVAKAVVEALTEVAKMEKEESDDEESDEDEEDEGTMNKSEETTHKDKSNFMEKSTTKTIDSTPQKTESTIQVSAKRDRFGRNIKYL